MESKNSESMTQLAKFFRGFGDPNRLAILEALRGQTQTVSEIVERLKISQPTVSSHLACLRECGLVRSTQSGRFVQYQLGDYRIDELLALARVLLADVGRGVYECTRYDCADTDLVKVSKVSRSIQKEKGA